MTLLAACVQNFGGLFALRFFLGVAESGFFPLVIYYLTTFYRRGELARRLAVFYAASNIANAFVSFNVTQRGQILTRTERTLIIWSLPDRVQDVCMALSVHH
jgi:MFS family permease